MAISEETRQKLREAARRSWANPDVATKRAAGIRGHNVSDEARRRIGEANKKHLLGRPVSQETRDKISNAQKGKPRRKHTEEEKARISATMKGRWPKAATLAAQANNPSSLEKSLAAALDAAGVAYEAQKDFGGYVADFFLADCNTIIECNGCYWHACEPCGFAGPQDYDRRRWDFVRAMFFKNRGVRQINLWEHSFKAGAVATIIAEQLGITIKLP